MELKLVRQDLSGLMTDALVLFGAEGRKRPELERPLAALYDSGEITGKFLEFTLVHQVEGFAARRVLIAGSGKPEKLDAAALGKLASAAVRLLKSKGAKRVALALDGAASNAANVTAVAEGALAGSWEPDLLKTEKDGNKVIETVEIAVAAADAELDAALERGRILGEALNLSRDIAVEPPNRMTPMAMAERARAMAGEAGLTFDVLDQDRMRQLGMGALLGVAQGSAEPPAMIVIQYKPEKASGDAHLALVGKGVTFDTGGISIKPSEGMEKMKYDMAGGAAVIGAMQAIARLKPGIAVTGVVPAVENMPGARAQRPSDIVKSLSGKTIEILNTDAEGRLILADAITYAKQLGCTHLVDAATLTGAIVVALGYASSGVFTNNDAFLERWMNAAKGSGEKMWHMPLYDEYREMLKTVYADIQNIGGRWGGACTAAMFLKEFVGDTPWIHVDIAGTAWLDDAKPYLAKGPTGIPLGTFVELATGWA
ncbi:MAG TPA: leucyl aminopeptidase [Bryobacteraceae bacterium]|nr:leucyl aminopeptidase [Bryobacteraceae bacterium]